MTAAASPKIPLGTVSHATLRPEDLIPTYISFLQRFMPADAKRRGNLEEIEKRVTLAESGEDVEAYYRSEDCGHDLEELTEMMEELAPAFVYFGVSPGDSSDFGFWVDHEEIDEAAASGDLLKLGDLSDLDHRAEELEQGWNYAKCMIVNDHGNCTLYDVKVDRVFTGGNEKKAEWVVEETKAVWDCV